jgi:hypothetical protein
MSLTCCDDISLCGRHWREIALSLTHELTLLRWEEKLQRDLGKSILDLIKSLSTSAAEVH